MESINSLYICDICQKKINSCNKLIHDPNCVMVSERKSYQKNYDETIPRDEEDHEENMYDKIRNEYPEIEK